MRPNASHKEYIMDKEEKDNMLANGASAALDVTTIAASLLPTDAAQTSAQAMEKISDGESLVDVATDTASDIASEASEGVLSGIGEAIGSIFS
jgi:hypothetical protein